jgi:CDP-glycerol glycerophosphotransferase (TagB/SpsB family)
MRGILVIIAVLIFASTGMAGEYFKWTDERGVVHFTDTEAKVPEKYKTDAERRVMPSEKETPSERSRESAVATEQPAGEPKDRFGRGRDFWVNWTNEARNRLMRAQDDYNRLLVEYKQAQADWTRLFPLLTEPGTETRWSRSRLTWKDEGRISGEPGRS